MMTMIMMMKLGNEQWMDYYETWVLLNGCHTCNGYVPSAGACLILIDQAL